jgi:anaerobic magnesium-protoporphyrin IX monomethyl ester cyclase
MRQEIERSPELRANLGTRRVTPLRAARFPDAGAVVQTLTSSTRPAGGVEVMLVNPPAPDGGIWIRSQHRVGRRSRENMIWPQVSLAQMAALLVPEYTVEVVDAIATHMSWPEFERLLEEKRPKYYLTQVTAPTLRNDMHGVFLAKAMGAHTIAFGTHVTPLTLESMRPFPQLAQMLALTSASASTSASTSTLASIPGLAWRDGREIVINPDRPFIPDLDDLPIPLHELLPLDKQRMPMIKGPFTFIVSSRGCPAGCKFCIKHVSYQYSVRLRSPENILAELQRLAELGLHNVHMYADLFTVNRDQVLGLCQLIISSGLKVRWTCNSRVDYVDEEMLRLMGQAGCWLISWGIESANEQILKHARKGYRKERAIQALRWARAAGIKNWGYFILGLPGETEESIRETIAYSKQLPLDIALFHIAAPYPGTPFFFEVVEKGWFRPGTRWEEVDMDQSTVLDYPGLPAERLEYWQKRATLEWSLRPGPILTFLKGLNTWDGFKSAVSVGWQTLQFVTG